MNEYNASLQVAEKVGATREGVLRSRLVVQNKVHDVVMFSLVRQDYAS
jgi:RimJ/RimL family protein N-acetyltransferase